MKLCESQQVLIFGVILIIVSLIAYAFGQLDLKAVIASCLGEGSVTILAFWLLMKNASNTKDAKVMEAKAKFRKWFYYFPSKWSGYKTLIQNGTMGKPEVEQPNTFADQMHESLEGLTSMGIVFNPEMSAKIRAIINEIDTFGYELRIVEQLPPNQRRSSKNIENLLDKGQAITNAIEAISGNVDALLGVK